jgi:hypothetical protein
MFSPCFAGRLSAPGIPISVPLTNPVGWHVKWEGKDTHWMQAEACDLV